MIGFPVLAMSLILNIVAVLFILSCIILVLVVLIQKGKGGGLSGAFGGGLASNLLGSKTGDFLTWVTIMMVGVFLILAVVLAKWYRPGSGSSVLEQGTEQQQPVTPATTPSGGEIPGSEPLPDNATEPVGTDEVPSAPDMTATTATDPNSGG